jgi:hypothetical protein
MKDLASLEQVVRICEHAASAVYERVTAERKTEIGELAATQEELKVLQADRVATLDAELRAHIAAELEARTVRARCNRLLARFRR